MSEESAGPSWTVYLTRKAEKQAAKLPEEIFEALAVLRKANTITATLTRAIPAMSQSG